MTISAEGLAETLRRRVSSLADALVVALYWHDYFEDHGAIMSAGRYRAALWYLASNAERYV